MSVFEIYKGDGGAKFMRPIHNREEYLRSLFVSLVKIGRWFLHVIKSPHKSMNVR